MRDHVLMTVGAGDIPLAPTFEAWEQIEQALDTALPRIYMAHAMGALDGGELAQIVTIGANAAEPKSADLGTVKRHLFAQGAASDAVRRPIAEYLLALGWTPEEAKSKFAREWSEPGAETEDPAEVASS